MRKGCAEDPHEGKQTTSSKSMLTWLQQSKAMSTATLIFFCATICCSLTEKPSNVSSPNIIIMLMDDVSYFLCCVCPQFITSAALSSEWVWEPKVCSSVSLLLSCLCFVFVSGFCGAPRHCTAHWTLQPVHSISLYLCLHVYFVPFWVWVYRQDLLMNSPFFPHCSSDGLGGLGGVRTAL